MMTISWHILTPHGQAILAEDISSAEVDRLALHFYNSIGGAEFFERITFRFYELVTVDDELGPLFADRPAHIHAKRLAAHFDRMYGVPNLSEGWSERFVRAHSLQLFSNDHRRRWLELMRRAGEDVGAPEPWFSDMMAVLTNASGVVLGISRGAALARGERFDREGKPKESPKASGKPASAST
jgi:truncated hemoglobin YjbI